MVGGGRCTLGGHLIFRIMSLLRYVVDIGKSSTHMVKHNFLLLECNNNFMKQQSLKKKKNLHLLPPKNGRTFGKITVSDFKLKRPNW